MVLVMNENVLFREAIAVAEMNDFQFHTVEADALVAVLAVDQGLAVLELDHMLAAGFFFREVEPRAVVEDVAVLQDFDEGRASVRGCLLERVLQVAWKTSTERATNVASAPIARPSGLNGRSAVPKGVDLVFLPNSEVGEYWPLVRP